MTVGIVGTGAGAERRAQAVEAAGGGAFVGLFDASALADYLPTLDALFVALPTAEHFAAAEAAARQGVHVFLEWPPAPSIPECQALVQLSEEASIEVGVSRPLRYHGLFTALPPDWRARLVVLRQARTEVGAPVAGSLLDDAVDLCCTLARSGSVRRVDGEAVRGAAARPEAVAFALRFHSGAYAQVSLRQGALARTHTLYAAGPGLQVEADLGDGTVRLRRDDGPFETVHPAAPDPLEAEARAFLDAVAARRAAPVSALDGLHTMRLVERLHGRLR